MKTLRSSASLRHARRGSVLLVSLLLSAVIAISIGSFLNLATLSSKLSYRTYYAGAAMNVAECGLEQALWSLNRALTDPDTAWENGWTYDTDTKSAKRTIDFGTLAGGATAVVKIYAREKQPGVPPMVISRAIITPGNDTPIEKWVQVDLRQRSRHDTGAVGLSDVSMSGASSWNSDSDGDPSTPYVPWSEAVNNDWASVASAKVKATKPTVSVGNNPINGTAAVGSKNVSDVDVGPNGHVGPFGTPAGTIAPGAVSTDFTADLEDISAPAVTGTALGSISDDLTLPKNPGSDKSITDAKGVTTYYYDASEIKLNGKVLTIAEGYNVVLNVANDIDIGGNDGAISVNSAINNGVVNASTLQIYTPGDIKISGKGAANTTNVTTTTASVTIPETFATSTIIPGTPATTVQVPQTTTVVTTTLITPLSRVKVGNTVLGWNMRRSVSTVTTVTRSGTVVSTTNGGPTTTDYFDITKTTNSAPNDSLSSSTASTNTTVPIAVPATAATTVTTPATAGYTIPGTTTVATQLGQPIAFQIYGTRPKTATSRQDIQIAGNGKLSGVIYAPYADIKANGGGNSGGVYGAIVGYTITFTGHEMFYYDESLGNLKVTTPYGIDEWDELVSYADRSTFGSVMDF
ncbi:MAG: hypothetical protein H7067_01680 [Burkholderiales bacterium]|nr:hypothetical protein [Opitutaceae bacterium]